MTRQDSPSPHCLDGETLAAWSSGSLRASEAATVEGHLSNCERCQSMLATFVRIEPPPAAPESVWRRWHLAWLVPVATAATVTAIWVAIPTERPESLQQSSGFEARSPDVAQPRPQLVAPTPPPAAPSPAPPAAPRAAREPEAGKNAALIAKDESLLAKRRLESEEGARKRTANEADRRASDSLGATAASSSAPQAAAPPPPAVLERRDEPAARSAREKVEVTQRNPLADANTALIVSPVPSYRWRITGGRQVDRSSSGGEQWQRVAIPDSERLTAGHSPSASVAWLVGPAGTIYVTSDGARFDKIPFVEPIDLVAVVAIDDRQATVTTADGRSFQTMDRGVTWSRVP